MVKSNEIIYERIAKLCKAEGITCAELQRRVGISTSTLTELKAGRSKTLSAKASSKIADYFGVSVDYLMTGEEPQSKPEVTEQDIKVALFNGDKEVTDEMWEEVKNFAELVALKYRYKKNDDNKS